MHAWLNEQPSTTASIRDRGLLLGDGHFTTIKIANGELCSWPLHQKRLAKANQAFGFDVADWQPIVQFLQSIAQFAGNGCIRLTLTRGESGRGYEGAWGVSPNRIVTLSELPAHYSDWQQTGINCGIGLIRLSVGGSLVGLKTLGRAEQVLLKQELAQSVHDDLVVLDVNGNIVEATAGNLFFVDGDTVITPQLSHSGIAGVLRTQLLSVLPKLGMKISVRQIALKEHATFDSAFTSNCLMGVVPINCIGATHYQHPPFIHQLKELL